VGKGSTFHFTVCFAKGAPEAAASEDPEAIAQTLQGRRVAIIDDNATNRCLLQHYVASWGGVSTSFSNGPEALEALAKAVAASEPYELALLDFHMPEMDGLQVAQRIFADRLIPTGHCLLLTSLDHQFEKDYLSSVGVSQMMTKPIRKNELRTAVLTALAPHKPATETKHVVTAPAPVPAVPAAGAVSYRVLIAEDNVVNQRVAKLQLQKLGHRVDLAGNGVEVLDAIGRGYYDVILMDCQMPEVDGYEATRRIRSGLYQFDIPIIAMTAHAMEGDRDLCLKAGMDDYVSKPTRIQDVATALERLQTSIMQRRTNRNTSAPFVHA
jgi:CheY-like chemotaxis protein